MTVRGEAADTRELVLEILAEHPEARDSDLDLLFYYIPKRYGLAPTASWATLLRVVKSEHQGGFHFETVRRMRAQIQSEGLYPPSVAVAGRRAEREEDWRAALAPDSGVRA